MTLSRSLAIGAAICLSTAATADVAYVTNEQGGLSVVDLGTAKVVQQIDVGGKIPRGVAVTDEGTFVLTANKGTNDISVINSRSAVVTRIPLGPNPEFLRIRGSFAYVTYEPGSSRAGGESQNHDEGTAAAIIAVIDLHSLKVVRTIKSGRETEGIEFSRDGKRLITTNEGDETISVYELPTGRHINTIDTRSYGARPRGLKRAPSDNGYAVTFEGSSDLVLFDKDFGVVKSVKTANGPNGVSFDPSGKLLLVAAARAGLLQFFDSKTLQLVREVPVGKRCWHFTFTPDNARILVACGRTDNIVVVDAQNYSVQPPIEGLKIPWGVVTYPRAAGSLDLP